MGNIVLLDDLTINQIAAGEVIERPANVVKELVENSIDAGATNIVIEIKNGGKTFIRISDNGKGISVDDMPIALERHATSKIRKIEDLEHTYTMGFRGEALASIVSISRVTIISKTQDMPTGIKLFAEAGDILGSEEVGAKVGTTITVEDLFFNVPVRYKFLKNDATEFRYIKELVQKIALANLNVAIKLINDGKTVFQSTGNGNIHDIVYTLFGKEVKDNLIEVDHKEGDVRITGVVGNTLMAKDSRKNQIFFLNKRNIKNQVLTSSADQAFKGGTGIGKYGFFILNVEMPATFYDVNVHPTKMEVRFKDDQALYKIMYHAIKEALLNKEFLGNTDLENNKDTYIQNEFEFLTNHYKTNEEQVITPKEDNITEVVDNSKYINTSKIVMPNIEETNSKYINMGNDGKLDLINRDEIRNVDYKYCGIVFRTFIMIEINNELYLVDQHAAHERVLYEQIKENYKNNMRNNSQLMLFPEVVNLTHKEMEFVQNNLELFQNYGFDIELFGENSIKINGIPDIEYKIKIDTKDVFMDVLDEMLTKERTTIKDVEERFIATVACKAAVKANMDLVEDEVHKLLDRLLRLKNPYTCPHGRPTTIKIGHIENGELKTI
ncbi:MAG: DNA mismatch repair endonuclease MutL [Clostridia bacterium]|nr:DNA mismatch repair endonuclease MutL [Clostridia bacterium]